MPTTTYAVPDVNVLSALIQAMSDLDAETRRQAPKLSVIFSKLVRINALSQELIDEMKGEV